jgi:hypothetical protein
MIDIRPQKSESTSTSIDDGWGRASVKILKH